MYYGYELVDPRDELPFYVGITQNLEARYQQHLTVDPYNPEKHKRVKSILNAGLRPTQKTLFSVEEEKEARSREKAQIQLYLANGVTLTNKQYAEQQGRVTIEKVEKLVERGPISYDSNADLRLMEIERQYSHLSRIERLKHSHYLNDCWEAVKSDINLHLFVATETLYDHEQEREEAQKICSAWYEAKCQEYQIKPLLLQLPGPNLAGCPTIESLQGISLNS